MTITTGPIRINDEPLGLASPRLACNEHVTGLESV